MLKFGLFLFFFPKPQVIYIFLISQTRLKLFSLLPLEIDGVNALATNS